MRGSVIRDNSIHDLHSNKPDAHYDGIFIGSGREIEIVDNTIVNNQTSAIMRQNVFGGISDIKIDGNRLSGAASRSTSTNVTATARSTMRPSA